MHQTIRAAWTEELVAARASERSGELAAAWRHLERTHVLSRPLLSLTPDARAHAGLCGAPTLPRRCVGRASIENQRCGQCRS